MLNLEHNGNRPEHLGREQDPFELRPSTPPKHRQGSPERHHTLIRRTHLEQTLPHEQRGGHAELAEELRERYPDMFKPSHGCRPPHINVDVLREELHRDGAR